MTRIPFKHSCEKAFVRAALAPVVLESSPGLSRTAPAAPAPPAPPRLPLPSLRAEFLRSDPQIPAADVRLGGALASPVRREVRVSLRVVSVCVAETAVTRCQD